MSILEPDGAPEDLPRIPASAGALIFDHSKRLLILKPNYKKGWTVPGGQIDASGESPWAACRRETLEECGLAVQRGRLLCVDFLAPRPGRPGGVRFLFHCGMLDDDRLATIRLQAQEIDAYQFADVSDALVLLSGPLRRRVSASIASRRCVYLEEGKPVRGVKG
ncbi:MAG: NUDIX domain-containing protein [Solirubrobacteraceae bacterium]